MNTPIKLSVSSILLAGILSGCSQQQIQPDRNGHNYAANQATSQQQVKAAPRVVHQPKVVKKHVHQKRAHANSNIGMPPAKPGQCYAKTKQPAKYKTVNKRVLTQKATVKRVLVRGPQFRWINKKVLVRPATHKQRVIPAQYKNVSKRVMVKPSYLKWQKGTGLITRIDNTTGEILCRVKVPAVYKNVTRKVLVRPARTIKTPVAPVYKTVKTKQQISGAQYKTVKTPARYTNKQYRVKTASAKYVWRQVICKTNAPHHVKKPMKARHVQKARVKTFVNKYPQHRVVKAKHQPHRVRHVTRAKAKPQHHKRHHRAAPKRHNVNKQHYRKATYSKKMASPSMARVNHLYQPKKSSERYTLHKAAAELQKTRTVKQQPRKVNKPKERLTRANAVFRIQSALAKKGYNPGKIDGKLGSGTVSALTAFQRANGLPTGKLNRATLKALGLI